MKTYLIIVQNDTTAAIYGYDDYDAALAAFHTELAYRGEGRESTMCVIVDSHGNTLKREMWQAEGQHSITE